MVEDAVQTGQAAIGSQGVLAQALVLELFHKGVVVVNGGVGNEGFVAVALLGQVRPDAGGGDTGRCQPQQVGVVLHLLHVGLVHQFLDIGGALDVGGQVFQQTLSGNGLVAALEVDEVRVHLAVHDGQRHGGLVAAGGGIYKLYVDILTVGSHFFVDGGHQRDNVLLIGENVLADDLYGNRRVGGANGGPALGIGGLRSGGSGGICLGGSCGGLSGSRAGAASGQYANQHGQDQQQRDVLFHSSFVPPFV